eukprot:PhF_6_TR6201/c0_g1_i4/m.9330
MHSCRRFPVLILAVLVTLLVVMLLSMFRLSYAMVNVPPSLLPDDGNKFDQKHKRTNNTSNARTSSPVTGCVDCVRKIRPPHSVSKNLAVCYFGSLRTYQLTWALGQRENVPKSDVYVSTVNAVEFVRSIWSKRGRHQFTPDEMAPHRNVHGAIKDVYGGVLIASYAANAKGLDEMCLALMDEGRMVPSSICLHLFLRYQCTNGPSGMINTAKYSYVALIRSDLMFFRPIVLNAQGVVSVFEGSPRAEDCRLPEEVGLVDRTVIVDEYYTMRKGSMQFVNDWLVIGRSSVIQSVSEMFVWMTSQRWSSDERRLSEYHFMHYYQGVLKLNVRAMPLEVYVHRPGVTPEATQKQMYRSSSCILLSTMNFIWQRQRILNSKRKSNKKHSLNNY